MPDPASNFSTNAFPVNAPVDVVVTMDFNGRIVDWPAPAETTFGWTRNEAAGRLMASLLIPDRFRDGFWAEMERLQVFALSESPAVYPRRELTSLRKSGEEFFIELTMTTLPLQEQLFFIAMIRNLSIRRKQESAASRQTMHTRLLHQATAFSAVGDTFHDALQKCIETLCSITGWPVGHALVPDEAEDRLRSTDLWYFAPEEDLETIPELSRARAFRRGKGLVGRIWEEVEPTWTSDFHEEDPAFQQALAALGLSGAFGFPVSVEGDVVAVLEFFTRDEVAPDAQILMTINNLANQLGRLIERRRWIEERSRLAAIVDSSYDAIIGKDLHGRIITWNTGAEQVYGYKADEVLGESSDLLFPEGLDEEEAEITDALRIGQRLKQFETTRRRKDGSLIEVSLTVSPIRNSRGQIVGSSTIERDISLRVRREQELEEAKLAAERANQTKTEFLANISHELRTPMNAILGMLDLALGERLSEVMQDYLNTAHESAKTLLYLLNDLLDFSRIEAGHLELEDEPFPLRETLNAVMKSLSVRASEKGLELAGHVNHDVPNRLQGDGLRLRQILVNLAGNAIKFTEQGEVVVEISLKSKRQDQVELLFQVRDTGIGIPPEDQERIFHPFTQVDASTTRSKTGSGLGLAIVRELAEKMGGRVWLESVPGAGTSFFVAVPFPVLPELPAHYHPAELVNLPVLVVDDNQTNRTILKETLTGWSMRPTVVDSAQAALAAIRQAEQAKRPFPLVIVDALMPEMDGFTLIETLKSLETKGSQPLSVLMLSSADRQTFKERCDRLNVAAYLEKPVSQSELLDTVMTVLQGPPLQREAFERVHPTRRALQILLAEDTPANQKVVRAILEKRGHRVSIANNGREAVDRLKQAEFDAVLMDVQMPTMDGLQATQAIRQLPAETKREVPIIAMTAHARREDRRKCLDAGMDAYISKPMDAAKLIRLVETVQRQSAIPLAGDSWEGSSTWEPLRRTSKPLINAEAALARMGGDQLLVLDLARFFLEDVPKLLAELEKALLNQQVKAAERAAHSLKGLAANFDAEIVVTHAQEIEEGLERMKLARAHELLPLLQDAVNQVSSELRRLVQSKSG